MLKSVCFSVQSGMLNWISNGFASTLPQPAGSPLLTRYNPDAKVLISCQVLWVHINMQYQMLINIKANNCFYFAVTSGWRFYGQVRQWIVFLSRSTALRNHCAEVCLTAWRLYSELSVSARAGVIGWISQGLGKVMPQPDEKYIKDETPEPDEVTEVRKRCNTLFLSE